jgi:hypothetical protein
MLLRTQLKCKKHQGFTLVSADSDVRLCHLVSTVCGQEVRALANAGATVILLHHRAKSETSRYRGSSDIAGGVDLAISVSRDRAAGVWGTQNHSSASRLCHPPGQTGRGD